MSERLLAVRTRISIRSALSQGYRGRLTARFPLLTSDCRMLAHRRHTKRHTLRAGLMLSHPPISVQQKRHMLMPQRM